jgi:prolyl oligopeptidase
MLRSLALVAALGWPLAAVAADMTVKYPTAARGPVVDTVHGVQIADPYRWLEDPTSAATQAWMTAEDKLARDFSARVPARAKLLERLNQVFYVDSLQPPTKRGDRYFYRRTLKGQEKPSFYVREGGKERLLIDDKSLSPDGTTTLGNTMPSWDGKRVAYVVHPNNSDAGIMHVLDVATGKPLSDVLEGADYTAASWTPANDAFYYTWLPSKTGQPSDADRFARAEVRLHKLGTPQAKDVRIHESPGDARVFVSGNVSKDGHWLFYQMDTGSDRSDVWFRDTRKPGADWTLLTPKLDSLYAVDVHRDVFYVTTNEGAPRWRVFRVDPARPARADWREIVPERKDVNLQSASVLGGQLLVTTTHNAVSGMEIRSLDGALTHTVTLPGPGTVDYLSGDEDDDDAFLRFASFVQAPEPMHLSIKSGQVTPWGDASQAGPDMSAYVVEQVWFPSKDGTKVSMFVVHKKDAPQTKTGSTPTILYGYGGFSIGITPAWHAELVPWLEAGGIYAAANLRGGDEYGEDWHKAGMREHKQNVFDDFAAAADWLIAQKWTRPDKLAIYGRSNGGLLVGAAMTQHPERYRAVLCGVPLLDMVRFHLFGGGKTWTPEYGSPENQNEFKYLYAYSPYHHLRAGVQYPALYMLSADADDRVEPMHARKFVAELQHLQGGSAKDGRPVLLRIERHSGHAGGDRPAYNSQLVGYWADAYAFLFRELQMK